MHDSALLAALTLFDAYAIPTGARVVELGSRDVNGSLRSTLSAGRRWTGVDLCPGPGVDVVLDDPHTLPFDDATFDLAIATSVLEHDPMFWVTFVEMVRVVRPGGIVYLHCPSNGHIHRFPVDCWRFLPDAAGALAQWSARCGRTVALVESMVLDQQGSEWSDFVAVFVVGDPDPRPRPLLVERLPVHLRGPGIDAPPLPATQPTEDQERLARAEALLHPVRTVVRKLRWELGQRRARRSTPRS